MLRETEKSLGRSSSMDRTVIGRDNENFAKESQLTDSTGDIVSEQEAITVQDIHTRISGESNVFPQARGPVESTWNVTFL